MPNPEIVTIEELEEEIEVLSGRLVGLIRMLREKKEEGEIII